MDSALARGIEEGRRKRGMAFFLLSFCGVCDETLSADRDEEQSFRCAQIFLQAQGSY